MRAALRADLREHPRFDVDMTAVGRTARIEDRPRACSTSAAAARASLSFPHVAMGADATVTFGGMRPLKGKIAWIAGGCFGVRFEPVMLEAGELLKLTGLDKAA